MEHLCPYSVHAMAVLCIISLELLKRNLPYVHLHVFPTIRDNITESIWNYCKIVYYTPYKNIHNDSWKIKLKLDISCKSCYEKYTFLFLTFPTLFCFRWWRRCILGVVNRRIYCEVCILFRRLLFVIPLRLRHVQHRILSSVSSDVLEYSRQVVIVENLN